MNNKKQYDVIIIGAGAAGFSAMEAASNQGVKVCLIEKNKLGGECPNDACIPSKALLHAAKMFRHTQKFQRFTQTAITPQASASKIADFRDQVVKTITGGGEVGDRYVKVLQNKNIDHIIGEAIFVDKKTIEVNGEKLSAKAFVVATGTKDFIPSINGIDKVPYVGWREAVQGRLKGREIVIIGAGPVGCEIATYYASIGREVTLLQAAPAVLHREDAEISTLAKEALERLGVEVVLEAKIEFVQKAADKIHITTADVEYVVDHLIIATGKRSNAKEVGLESAEVELDHKDTPVKNEYHQTSQSHIFTAGDVDGGMQFTHTAHHEGAIAGHNAAIVALGKKEELEKNAGGVVPRVTFIQPEVASVGITQEQALKEHPKVLVGRYKVAALGRAVTDSERFGLVKVIAHPKTRKILGAHMIGERAGEVIHEAALAMHLHATLDDLKSMIHAFPTYSEGLKAAAASTNLE